MRTKLIANIKLRFQAFADLARELNDGLLSETLSVAKNKSLKDHIWCIVGARESYTHALQAGEWAGFNCSLLTVNKSEIIKTLSLSAEAFDSTVNNIQDWTDTREHLLLDLLEHETMHEGQIIRHMYGLEKTLPGSWKWA